MKRSTLLLFLLLLPFTMAPRTSMIPDPSSLDISLVLARTEVTVGTPVRAAVLVKNVTTTATAATAELRLGWTGEVRTLLIEGLPEACTTTTTQERELLTVLDCPLGELRAGEATGFQFWLTPLQEGHLTVKAAGLATSGHEGDLPTAELIVERRPSRR